MNEKAFLSINNLTVEYTSNKKVIHAVNGVSLHLNHGETLGLVGETGAGKTTIAKSILRILPNPPARIKGGEIFLGGEDLMKKAEREMLDIRGNKIAMIFQDPMTALNPLLTVGEQIAEVISIHEKNLTKDQAEKKAMEMLEMVGITAERYIEFPFQFSGGMKQRVVIAMALACNPQILLADEPTTALDVTIQAQVLQMIKKLQEKNGTAMLLITHDLGVVAETCENVAVIYAGEIIESGTREDLFDHPTHPYTCGLFDSLPKLTVETKRLSPISGMTPDPSDLPKGCKFHPRCKYATETCTAGEVPNVEVTPGHFCQCWKCVGYEQEGK